MLYRTQLYHIQDSARLDFVELRPAKVSKCKYRRVSPNPRPSSATPLAKRYPQDNLRPMHIYLGTFPMHPNSARLLQGDHISPGALPPPTSFRGQSIDSRGKAVGNPADPRGFRAYIGRRSATLLTELSTGGQIPVGVGKRTERFFRESEAR